MNTQATLEAGLDSQLEQPSLPNPDAAIRQAFRIGSMHLAAPFETASELLEMPKLFALPRMPNGMRGVANLHGRIIPVFDLAPLLRVEHLPRVRQMLLVIGHGDDGAGIVVDGLPRRMEFLNSEQYPEATVAPGVEPYRVNAWKQMAQVWFELDYVALLYALSSQSQLQ